MRKLLALFLLLAAPAVADELCTTSVMNTCGSGGGGVTIASNNTWTGQQTFRDNKFTITDDSDTTKAFIFQASGISTATTRTFTLPNFDATFATLAGTETFTNKSLTSPLITNLTAGRITFAGTSGLLTDDSDCTFSVDTLTCTKMAVGVATGTSLTLTTDDAATNTVTDIATITHTTSGTAAAGLGAGLLLQAESAGGTTRDIGAVRAIYTNATDATGTRKSRLVFAAHAPNLSGFVNLWAMQENTPCCSAMAAFGPSADLTTFIGMELGNFNVVASGTHALSVTTGGTRIPNNEQYTFSSTTGATASTDTGFARNAAGVVRLTDGSTGIRGLLGGGASVASATALPVPTGRVFHVTGTTDITSITSTNFAAGAVITLIFDGVLNFTDGSNLKLASTMATTADDTITLVYDGTNWFETGRSVN